MLGGVMGIGESVRTGTRIRATGVQHDCVQGVVAEYLLRPQHRRGLETVRRKHCCSDVGRPVVHDDGDIGLAGRLNTGGHAAGSKTLRRCDTHGATPLLVRPAVSSSPNMRFAFCSAWPAAPLPRLSIALTTTMRPACSSNATCR